jgi:hypothetical protein
MKRKNALNKTPMMCPQPLRVCLIAGPASAAYVFAVVPADCPNSLAFSPHCCAVSFTSEPQVCALDLKLCMSSFTVFRIEFRSTFSPRISSFSAAVVAIGTEIHRMMYVMNNVLPRELVITFGPHQKSISCHQKLKGPETNPIISGRAKISRGIQGLILKYTDKPPQTPPITLSSVLRYNLFVIFD